MKVLQTIPSFDEKSGGPSTCTRDLIQGLNEVGSKTDLLTVEGIDSPNISRGEDWLIEVQNDCISTLGYSRNLRHSLMDSSYDLYHCNAIWRYANHITCKVARLKKKPYVITPHGMLYPTALAIKPLVKKVMRRIWFDKDIQSATCLHATCQEELQHIRAYGYKGPVAVIPNCVVFPENLGVKTHCSSIDGRLFIGFLGRLHPIKKVENLIYALTLLPKDMLAKVSLQIIGKYDETYEQFLRNEVARFNLNDTVEFIGFISGDEKYRRLSELSALFVPSEQENFGMIIPEALICGTPVCASLGTPWKDLIDNNCGWWVDNSPQTIARVISEILIMPETELLKMGLNGRALIEEKYEQHKVAGMMKALYEWIVEDNMKSSSKPGFVYL